MVSIPLVTLVQHVSGAIEHFGKRKIIDNERLNDAGGSGLRLSATQRS